MDDTPSLGAATGATAELGEELAVRDWVHKQLALEIERLRSQETRIVPVPTLNLSVVREGSVVVNRVECDTTFDFTKVTMLMVSPGVRCHLRPGYDYVNVVLYTEKPVPMLIPYIYDRAGQPENNLGEWVFVNKKGERARHSIDSFTDV